TKYGDGGESSYTRILWTMQEYAKATAGKKTDTDAEKLVMLKEMHRWAGEMLEKCNECLKTWVEASTPDQILKTVGGKHTDAAKLKNELTADIKSVSTVAKQVRDAAAPADAIVLPVA